MSNLYVTLPAPSGNGVGASVDVSALAPFKTIVVVGTAQASVNIEFNNDAAQAGSWQSAATIQNSGAMSVQVACHWMRVRLSNFNPNVGGAISVHLGAISASCDFASLPVPIGNGAGAAVDVSTKAGTYKTVQVGGPFQGTLLVEIAEDAGSEWAQPFSFGAPGAGSQIVIAKFMRVRRIGVPVINPGLPVVNVGFGLVTDAPDAGTVVDANYGDVTVSGAGSVWTVNQLPESRITNLTTDLAALAISVAAAVPATRTITTTAPLTIDGGPSANLSANRTLAINTSGLVPATRTLQGTSPIQIAGLNTPVDLSADRLVSVLGFTTINAGVVPQSVLNTYLNGSGTWDTPTVVTAALNTFTTALKGLVTPSTAAGNVLRGDGTWNTITQFTAALDVFTTALQGVVPASSAAANFLRGDATWSTVVQVTAALNVFTTALQGLVPASTAAGNVLRGDATWSTITQLTAALNVFTTALAGVVPASTAAGNVLRGDATWSTMTQITAALNAFTTSLQGVVPASGGGTANFLRADGTWAAPTGGAVPMFDTILTPAQITFGSAYDNWNPGALGQNTLIRCTTDGSTRSVRGLVGGVDGKIVCLMNANSSASVGENWVVEDAAATAANRFRTGFLSGGCFYYYDGTLARWVLIAGSG